MTLVRAHTLLPIEIIAIVGKNNSIDLDWEHYVDIGDFELWTTPPEGKFNVFIMTAPARAYCGHLKANDPNRLDIVINPRQDINKWAMDYVVASSLDDALKTLFEDHYTEELHKIFICG